MLSRSVSEGNNRIRTTSSSNNEVGRVLPDIPRPWLLFVSEYLWSFSEDFYESLRLLQNVTLFFGATYCLSRSVLQKAKNTIAKISE